MPSASSLFCCFLFQKSYFRKYSRNWMSIYDDFLCNKIKTWTKGEPEGTPRGQGWPLAANWGGVAGVTRPAPWTPPRPPSTPINCLLTSGATIIFQKHIPTPPPPRILVRGDYEAAPGMLPEGRSIPEGSTLPCLPMRWCVSIVPPWTTGQWQ